MIVYNQSQISAEQVTKILVRQTRKNQISKFVLSILVLISGISVLAYGYYNSESTYIGVGYAFFTFGIVYLAFSIYSVAGALKKVKKMNPDSCEKGILYEYNFKEQSIQGKAILSGKTTKFEYKYTEAKRIAEYEGYYEFFFKPDNELIVLKSGFESKRMEEFFVRNVKKNNKKIKDKTAKKK